MCTWFLIYRKIWLNLSRDDCHFLLGLPNEWLPLLATNRNSLQKHWLSWTMVEGSLEGKPHYESSLKNHCQVPRVNPIVVSFMFTQSSIVHLKQTIGCFLNPLFNNSKFCVLPIELFPSIWDYRTPEKSTANQVNQPRKQLHTSVSFTICYNWSKIEKMICFVPTLHIQPYKCILHNVLQLE
jgi:hypothetical protein